MSTKIVGSNEPYKAPKPFDPSKPVQTRDGRKARIVCTDAKGNYPIVALIQGSEEFPTRYTTSGYYFKDQQEYNLDLLNIPEERTVWVAFGISSDGITIACSDAKGVPSESVSSFSSLFPRGQLLAVKQITFHEGEGLEGGE